MAPLLVMLPYWHDWRTEKTNPGIAHAMCDVRHWADPHLPDLCPRLGQLFAEGSAATIYTLALLGFFALHFSEWITRGRPAIFLQASRNVLMIAGAMLGGLLAGVVVGPVITAYFGSLDRPFLEPDFLVVPSVLAVALMAFCVLNYRLETYTLERLLRSFLGALVGTFCAGIVLGALVGFLYLIGFIQAVFEWANNGFYDYDNQGYSVYQRYSYLLIAGLPYGMVFGLSFGVLIGVARLFTDPAAKDANETISA